MYIVNESQRIMNTSDKTIATQESDPSLQDTWTQGMQKAMTWGDRALDVVFMVLSEVEENLD